MNKAIYMKIFSKNAHERLKILRNFSDIFIVICATIIIKQVFTVKSHAVSFIFSYSIEIEICLHELTSQEPLFRIISPQF